MKRFILNFFGLSLIIGPSCCGFESDPILTDVRADKTYSKATVRDFSDSLTLGERVGKQSTANLPDQILIETCGKNVSDSASRTGKLSSDKLIIGDVVDNEEGNQALTFVAWYGVAKTSFGSSVSFTDGDTYKVVGKMKVDEDSGFGGVPAMMSTPRSLMQGIADNIVDENLQSFKVSLKQTKLHQFFLNL